MGGCMSRFEYGVVFFLLGCSAMAVLIIVQAYL